MSSQLTSKSWFDLWHYLRKSPTLGVLRQRLDKLLIIHPSKSAAITLHSCGASLQPGLYVLLVGN